MRILFIGAVDFSRHCLEAVLDSGGEIAAVFNPAPEDARFNSDYADLGPLCESHAIPLHRTARMSDPATVELARTIDPDVIFVFGLSQMIPAEMLRIPRLGAVGTHPALLPRGRGRHPLIWALVKGLEETGLTFFFLEEGVDSGDILWQRAFPIGPEDTAADLYARIKSLAATGIREFLPLLARGEAVRQPQDESVTTYWPKRGRKDGEIVWSGSATTAHNLIRALAKPYPGAHSFLNGDEIKLWRSRLRVGESGSDAPGTILDVTGSGFLVQCGQGVLEVLEWEPPVDGAVKQGNIFHSEAT